MPLVSPVTVAVVEGGFPVTVTGAKAVPPDEGVTAYEVIGEPPLAGAVHDTTADALPAVALTPVGAPAPSAPSASPAPTPPTPLTSRRRSWP